MPLLTEKSINSWAEKFAAKEGEPFREVLHAIGAAVMNGDLPATYCGEPIDILKQRGGRLFVSLLYINNPGVFDWVYLGLGEGNDDFPIKTWLDELMIATEDMTRWLEGRDAAIETREPALAPSTKAAAFRSWFAAQYPNGRPVGKGIKILRREFCDATGDEISTSTVRDALGLR
jgi:hypothetical protein